MVKAAGLKKIWRDEEKQRYPKFNKKEHKELADIFAEVLKELFPTNDELHGFLNPIRKGQDSSSLHKARRERIRMKVLDIFEINRMSIKGLNNFVGVFINTLSIWNEIDLEKYYLIKGDSTRIDTKEGIRNRYAYLFHQYRADDTAPTDMAKLVQSFIFFIDFHFHLLEFALDDENDKSGNLRIKLDQYGKDFLRNPEHVFEFYKSRPAPITRRRLDILNLQQQCLLDAPDAEINQLFSSYLEAFIDYLEDKKLIGATDQQSEKDDKREKEYSDDDKVQELENENAKLKETIQEHKNVDIIRTKKITDLIKKNKFSKYNLTPEKGKDLLERCRFKSGGPNFTLIGKKMKCHRDTAKRRLEDLGLSVK